MKRTGIKPAGIGLWGAVVLCLAGFFTATSAGAFDAYTDYRVRSSVYGTSSGSGSWTITDASGNELMSGSANDYSGTGDYQSQSSTTADVPAQFGTLTNPIPYAQYGDGGTSTAQWAAFAQSGVGYNKAGVTVQGQLTGQYLNQTYTASDGTSMNMNLSATTYVQADSQWDDLFLVTAKGMSGQQGTFQMTISLTGSFSGSNGSYSYQLFDYHSAVTAYASGGLSGSWVKDANNPNGAYIQNTLGANGATSTQNLTITANIPFIYGTPGLVTSELMTTLSDVGLVDFSNTAIVTGIILPSDSYIYFESGAPSDAYGTISGSSDGGYGFAPGEGPGGGSTVPLPGGVWLLAPGLAAFMALRRKMKK